LKVGQQSCPSLEDIVTKDSSPVKIKPQQKHFFTFYLHGSFKPSSSLRYTQSATSVYASSFAGQDGFFGLCSIQSKAQPQPDALQITLKTGPGLQLRINRCSPPAGPHKKSIGATSIYHLEQIRTQKAQRLTHNPFWTHHQPSLRLTSYGQQANKAFWSSNQLSSCKKRPNP